MVVTEPNLWPYLQDRADLVERGLATEFVPASDAGAVTDRLRGAFAYAGVPFDAAMAAAGTELRLVQITAAGTDHVEVDAMPSGATVCNAFGHERSVAEHVVMVLLAARRGLLPADAALRQGRWLTRMHGGGAEFATLDELVVGIVGLGHIGRAVVGLLGAMGVRTRAVTRTPERARGDLPGLESVAGMDAVGALFDECDAVVLCAPHSPETDGLVDRALADRLGPHGTLVNVGRGGLVRDEELHAALSERTLGSAALDVWSAGIATDHGRPSAAEFERLDNVVMTPHYSATATSTYRRRADEVARNLIAVATGAAPANVVRHARS
ncbi:NAD(P)-dependent oxidoreductase [Pseudonocardia nematodicida]|uniref:NAD(P)-dependent oxidoreductase n=1 Tax=Pseudonocardia nematodicida TaxID=1206997 RepID=A0ABV1KGA0_9PSEU